MSRACRRCGAALTGRGARNALLCPDCWTDILLRLEGGEGKTALAREYGVSYGSVKLKYMLYGGREV